ncbi:MAG: AI-2E family transporter, partial [Planctomycetota bacterium]|nr:AI-2E family transporter [Planctomycetota bacterium]
VVFAFRAILTPFLVAIFLAYLIDPVVERAAPLPIGKWRLGRGGAIIVIYAGILLVAWLGVRFGGPALGRQLQSARTELPAARAKLTEWAGAIDEEIDDLISPDGDDPPPSDGPPPAKEPVKEPGGGNRGPDEPPPEPAVFDNKVPYRFEFTGGGATEGLVLDRTDSHVVIRRGEAYEVLELNTIEREVPLAPVQRTRVKDYIATLFKDLSRYVNRFLAFAWDFARLVVGTLYGMVLVLMITAFLVIDRDSIVSFFQSLPPAEDREVYRKLTYYLDRGLAGVIRGQLAICGVNGVLTWIGLELLSVPYALLLGLIAGVFSLIPIFGTILSTIPIVLIALGAGDVQKSVLAFGWILFIHFIEANFLNPKIMGTASKIHPVVVIFALIAGEHAYGLAGALLAVPAASLIQSAFKFYVIDRVPEQFEPADDEAAAAATQT